MQIFLFGFKAGVLNFFFRLKDIFLEDHILLIFYERFE